MARWLIVTAVVAVATRAAADPAVRLVSDGDACDVTSVAERVRGLVGQRAVEEDGAGIVKIRLDRHGSEVFADVTFDDADGRQRGPRRVAATSCDALLDSIALVIALGMPQTDPSPSPEPPAAVPEVREPEVPLEVRVAPIMRDKSASEAAVIAGVSTNGSQQAVTFGLRWRHDQTSIALEASILSPEERLVGALGRVHISTTNVFAVACRHGGDLSLCGALGIGATRGSATGLYDGHDAVTPNVSIGARVRWEHGLWGGFHGRLEVGVDANAVRNRFDVDHMSVWSTSRFEGWAGAAMIARFL
jgi:hypothetical protein